MSLKQLNSNFSKLPKSFSSEIEGKWVAVMDGKIISYDENFVKLFEEISKKGLSKKVLFHKVPREEILIF